MTEYILRGKLAEDGHEMDFPVIRDGVPAPWIRARAHAYSDVKSQRGGTASENLLYLALPSNSLVTIGPREIPVPFMEGNGVKDVKRFKVYRYSLMTDSMCLVKIHPRTPYKIEGPYGELYHSFEVLETPEDYKKTYAMHFDPVYADETKGLAVEERGDRIITMPGVRIFPANCAYRLPGWLAGKFNGSPEFAFAWGKVKEQRKGEALHYHQEVMEPYIGLSGTGRLFIEISEGDCIYRGFDVDGKEIKKKGEVLEMKKGDVLLPMPGIAHRFVYDKKVISPYEHYVINYAERGMDKVPENDRVVLERE